MKWNSSFFALFAIMSSCAFPTRTFSIRVNKVWDNRDRIKQLTSDELTQSKLGYPVTDLRNTELKAFLHGIRADEISITYNNTKQNPGESSYLTSDLDSVLTISWKRNLNREINIKSVYYFFGKTKPKIDQVKGDIMINDNLWIQDRTDVVVITYD